MSDDDKKADISMEAMVAQAADRVKVLKQSREGLVEKRKSIAAQIKELDVEIDKAERVARALIPRQTKKRAVSAAAPSAPAFNPGSQ